jgi:hypothetical protein
MFPHCANPECSASFGKIHEGHLFRFRRPSLAGDAPSNSHAVAHAWLCARCCETHTLEYRNDHPMLMALPVPVLIPEPISAPMPARPRRRIARPNRRPRSRRGMTPQNTGNAPVIVLAMNPSGDFPERG